MLSQSNSKLSEEATKVFVKDLQIGLRAKQKYLSPKYFYDQRGSELFESICLQPEYYITRTEAEILKDKADEISKFAIKNTNNISIIELGSGTSIKTRILFRSIISKKLKQICYFPIDISETAVTATVNLLSADFPNIHVQEIIADYDSGLQRACQLLPGGSNGSANNKLILFLGSSIGNMDPFETIHFLRIIKKSMDGSDSLLVGFDLAKDDRVLAAAYNDAAGVTARFNLNLLDRINKELGGHFDLSLFSHKAFYNRREHRIEMHLVSKSDQTVYVDTIGDSFHFSNGETIHTENSYKYSLYRIEKLAEKCGMVVKKHFMDRNEMFDLCLLGLS